MKQAATQRTPLIEINEATCRMVGECYPENIQEFSAPVMSTLRSVVPAAGSFTVTWNCFTLIARRQSSSLISLSF